MVSDPAIIAEPGGCAGEVRGRAPAPALPPDAARLSTPARAARRAAQRRRATIARHGRTPHGPRVLTPRAVPAVPADLLPAERDRRRAAVARFLVRTMRSVPMPGVPPFSRRDRMVLGAAVALEALVVGLIAAASHR